MGLTTSLLCCNLDANDLDDKVHKSSPRSALPTQKPTPPKPLQLQQNVAKKREPKKENRKDVDDDQLVNETDTITNTNEELNQTPTLNNNNNNSNQNSNSNNGGGAEGAPVPAGSENPVLNVQNEDQVRNEAQAAAEALDQLSEMDLELDLTKLQEGQAHHPETGFLLGHKNTKKFGKKKCLILDLDETLVHSSFKYLRTADFVIPVEIDNQVHHVYVIKRPGVDEFLEKVGRWFEVVVFTASVSKYGDPLLNKLDIHRAVHHRLFRDSCYNYQGNFIKNLSQIGRPLSECIIIDNSPASYIFHPEHSIPISSWFSDTHDNELLDLLPFLEDISKPNVDDVGKVLDIGL